MKEERGREQNCTCHLFRGMLQPMGGDSAIFNDSQGKLSPGVSPDVLVYNRGLWWLTAAPSCVLSHVFRCLSSNIKYISRTRLGDMRLEIVCGLLCSLSLQPTHIQCVHECVGHRTTLGNWFSLPLCRFQESNPGCQT